MAKRLKAIWELTRLEHGIIYGLGVLVAMAIGRGGVPDLVATAAGVLGAVLAEMGAFALNDYYDVEVDVRNNRTDRPIVRGDVSRGEALGIAAAASLLSVVAMGFTGSAGAVVVLVGLIAFGVAYNARLKEYGIWGNIYIAFTMAAPFIFGSMLFAGNDAVLYVIAAIAFVVGLGREIMKGIMDVEGDALRNVRTVARTRGPAAARSWAVALYALGMALSPIPLFLDNAKYHMSPVYAASALASVAILAWTCLSLLKSHDVATIGRARTTTLAAMAVALLGVLAAALL